MNRRPILFAILSILCSSGCAHYSTGKQPLQTNLINAPVDIVWNTSLQILPQLGITIKNYDQDQYFISARKGITFWSWGDTVTLTFKQRNSTQTNVLINCQANAQLYDWGNCNRVTRDLFVRIKKTAESIASQQPVSPATTEITAKQEREAPPARKNIIHFDSHKKLVVKNLDPRKGVDPQTALVLTDVVINALAEYCSVQSLDALAALSQVVEEKLKAGCDDTSCIIEVAGAMDIAQVVTGNISKLGDTYMISLMLIQTKGENLGVVKRASEECTCTEAELIGMTRRAAVKLLQGL
jgi:hypothetical protein